MSKRDTRLRLLGSDPRCFYCGTELTIDTSTLDHVIPTSRGGSRGAENCVLACKPCNARKADRSDSEFRLMRGEPVSHGWFED